MEALIKIDYPELTISCSNTVSKIIVEFEDGRLKRIEVQHITENNGNGLS